MTDIYEQYFENKNQFLVSKAVSLRFWGANNRESGDIKYTQTRGDVGPPPENVNGVKRFFRPQSLKVLKLKS